MSAEFAVVLPAIVLVAVLGVSALSAGARQVRLQDAAADAARLVARGEDHGRAIGIVAAVGGAATVEPRGELICVTATAPAPPPLTFTELIATSCALEGGL